MVIAERQGKHLRYRISDPRVSRLVETLDEIFSGPVG
jgi:DNA-binding transcriptional ArsR family regulator